MNFAVIAAPLAALAGVAALALAGARDRVGAAMGFASVALFAGLGVAALGAAGAGVALALTGAWLAMLTLAGGALAGEVPEPRGPASPVAIVAAVCAGAALLFATSLAPPLDVAPMPAAPALSLDRGADLFVALAALIGAGGAVAAVLGFGERGVLGTGRGPTE